MTWRRYELNLGNSLLSEEYFSIRCILTNDYGSSARENVEFYNLREGKERIFDDIRTATAVHHANIVQAVKSCYKIKINFRESESPFHGVLLSKQHQCLTIVPLLQSNSGTIRVQKWRYCMIKVALLECKSGAIATQ